MQTRPLAAPQKDAERLDRTPRKKPRRVQRNFRTLAARPPEGGQPNQTERHGHGAVKTAPRPPNKAQRGKDTQRRNLIRYAASHRPRFIPHVPRLDSQLCGYDPYLCEICSIPCEIALSVFPGIRCGHFSRYSSTSYSFGFGPDTLTLHPFTTAFVLLVYRPRANLLDHNSATFIGHGKVGASLTRNVSLGRFNRYHGNRTQVQTQTLAARHSAKAPHSFAGGDARPFIATEPP